MQEWRDSDAKTDKNRNGYATQLVNANHHRRATTTCGGGNVSSRGNRTSCFIQSCSVTAVAIAS